MVFPPPGIARQDWKIVRALGEFVGVTLPYSDEEEMEERVQTLVPLTLNMDEVSQSQVSGKKLFWGGVRAARQGMCVWVCVWDFFSFSCLAGTVGMGPGAPRGLL